MGMRVMISPGVMGEEPEIAWVPTGTRAFWPDVHAGKIVVAQYVSDYHGADVYIAKGRFADDEMPDEMADNLITKAEFHKNLVPFGSIDIPFTLPDQRPSVLNILAHPIITLVTVEPEFEPEDYSEL